MGVTETGSFQAPRIRIENGQTSALLGCESHRFGRCRPDANLQDAQSDARVSWLRNLVEIRLKHTRCGDDARRTQFVGVNSGV